VLALPRPAAEAADAAWQEVVQHALDQLGALDPRDAIEAMLAIDVVALNAGVLDACRRAAEPSAGPDAVLRQRGTAMGLFRAVSGGLRQLDRQRGRPAAPERDWGDAAAELTAVWRAAPDCPAEAASGGKPAKGPAVIVRWIDELDDKELCIAVEQERREKAGEPELPRAPGEPKVLYCYKADDYIHKFKPDPKNFRKYVGWENMTMAERREFFGYKYDGPPGPPEALTPASRDAMLAAMAAEERLKDEYGM